MSNTPKNFLLKEIIRRNIHNIINERQDQTRTSYLADMIISLSYREPNYKSPGLKRVIS